MTESLNQRETEIVGGFRVPKPIAKQIWHEYEQRDVALVDLVNDYVMVNPSLELSLEDQN